MQKIKELIIVEGKHDIDFLKTFLCADFVKTDGTSIPTETINYLKDCYQNGKKFIILTDPDYPGQYIRNKLIELFPDSKICLINKYDVRKKGTIGVENATKEAVLNSLENLISYQDYNPNKLTMNDMIELGLSGAENSSNCRKMVGTVLFLGNCNAKTMLFRLNSLNYSREELIDKIKEILWKNA